MCIITALIWVTVQWRKKHQANRKKRVKSEHKHSFSCKNKKKKKHSGEVQQVINHTGRAQTRSKRQLIRCFFRLKEGGGTR